MGGEFTNVHFTVMVHSMEINILLIYNFVHQQHSLKIKLNN